MKKSVAVKFATTMFLLLAGFVALQGYWLTQLNLPYPLLASLAVSGGMMLGYAASVWLIVRSRAKNSCAQPPAQEPHLAG